MPFADHTPDEVRDALSRLDGTDVARLSLITGFTSEEIADLGGLVAPPSEATA